MIYLADYENIYGNNFHTSHLHFSGLALLCSVIFTKNCENNWLMFEYQTTEVPTESFFVCFLISMSFFSINAIGGVGLRLFPLVGGI